MKRHPSLQPLSREHHVALTLARRLRLAAEDGGRAAVDGAVGAFLAGWRAEVAPHFAFEEEHLLPLLTGEEGARLLAEHTALREAVAVLEVGPTAERCRRTGDLLHDHVRWEERELFPAIETRAAAAELEALRVRAEAHEGG